MDRSQLFDYLPHRKHGVVGIVFLGLVLGLVYVFLVPPWQHYDEPGHFEYAWLMANDPTALETRGYNQRMRRDVAVSMIENDFFGHSFGIPDLLSENEPIWIGISQVGDQPLYYWLISLPLRLVKYSDITSQLYIARLASLSLFTLVILSAWGIMAELIPDKHTVLIWLVPLTIVLIPGVIDIMSSVNNDVGAAAIFSVFLWGTIRLLKQGPKPKVILLVIAAALASYFTKSTIWLALPLLLISGLLIGFPPQMRWIPWIAITVLFAAMIYAFFGRGNSAGWVIPGVNVSPTRQAIDPSEDSRYALHITIGDQRLSSTLRQSFSPETRTLLKQSRVLITGRTWSNEKAVLEIGFNSGTGWFEKVLIDVDKQRESFAFYVDVPADAQNIWFEITGRREGNSQSVTEVFIDSLTLERTSKENLSTGTNLFFNPNGSISWLRIRSWVYNQLEFPLYVNINYAVYSFSNLTATNWYYRSTINYLVDTFWSRLGWGNVELPIGGTYTILRLVWFWGIIGAFFGLFRYRNELPWSAILFLLIAVSIVWTQTCMRGIGSLFGSIWIPSARYALPAIIPTVLGLCAGWHITFHNFLLEKAIPKHLSWILYLVFFATLNILAMISLIEEFYL